MTGAAPHFLQSRQRGAAMVELSLAVLMLCVLLLGIVELARFMWLFNTTAEASRLASRLASVCETGTAQQARIRARVQYFIEASGQLRVGQRSDWLVLSYSPASCTASNCTLVQARLSGLEVPLMIPVWSLRLPLPAWQSTQVREAMSNTVAGESNSAC